MRTNIALSLGTLLVGTALASAQYPFQGAQGYGGYPASPYGGYAGGPYGGVPYGGSPLSPYLNLANRGVGGAGLPGVNYYNFVRPNLPNANRMGMYNPGAMGWGARQSYFPTLQSLDEDSIPGQQRSGKKDEGGN